jgi:hypothetical protein
MHMNGFTDEERNNYIPMIYMNILESVLILLGEIKSKELKFSDSNNRVSCTVVLNALRLNFY